MQQQIIGWFWALPYVWQLTIWIGLGVGLWGLLGLPTAHRLCQMKFEKSDGGVTRLIAYAVMVTIGCLLGLFGSIFLLVRWANQKKDSRRVAQVAAVVSSMPASHPDES